MFNSQGDFVTVISDFTYIRLVFILSFIFQGFQKPSYLSFLNLKCLQPALLVSLQMLDSKMLVGL